MDIKQLADVFNMLAVEYQCGEVAATEEALVHVQRAIENVLTPEERAMFRSRCGLIYY